MTKTLRVLTQNIRNGLKQTPLISQYRITLQEEPFLTVHMLCTEKSLFFRVRIKEKEIYKENKI